MYPAVCGVCDAWLGDYETAEMAAQVVAYHMIKHR